ncbi:MAG TPA: SMP-30/gluconolactonase/LRE family protein [Chryseosolibacter sp.]|nr:SMP-30/gluconolactonase/LRE family protein [Chryseosolibacter sp.]
MKQILVVAFGMAAVTLSCQAPKENTGDAADTVAVDTVAKSPVSLALKWETDSVLTTCESVIYDPRRNMLYVSNINGQPDAKDKNGFISKITPEGQVSEVQWVKGLDAPKGMGISGDKLYVTDIDRVVEVDLNNGKITKTFAVQGAKFLNDIAVDGKGRIFVSDMAAGNILLIEGGKLSKWLENVPGPNGLFAQDSTLVMLSWDKKSINTIDMGTKQTTEKTTGIENLDGVEYLGDNSYIVSSWNGMIHYVDKDWKSRLLLDLRADSVNSADIEYIEARNLLLVPTFFKNTVRAYEVKR